MLAHSLDYAKNLGLFDAIAVSSDSDEILEAAKICGVDYLIKRPTDLATDSAAKLPVIQHCLLESEKMFGSHFDIIVDLDATSPIRIKEDIEGVLNLLIDSQSEFVITGHNARRNPYFNLVQEDKEGFVDVAIIPEVPFVRRQDTPRCFDMNSSIYAWTRSGLLNSKKLFSPKTKLYEMPEDRSWDIDSELDFEIVEKLMKRQLGNI